MNVFDVFIIIKYTQLRLTSLHRNFTARRARAHSLFVAADAAAAGGTLFDLDEINNLCFLLSI